MTYNVDQYAGAMRTLLPPGAAWNREPNSNLGKILRALAASYARTGQAAEDLKRDAMPISPYWLLEEWEKSLGLPNKCIGTPTSIGERQSLVAAKFVAGGGQSCAYYIAVAAALGVEITITEFRESIILDVGTVEMPLNNGELWAHSWRVNIITPVVITYFVAGTSASGEPLRRWGNQWLECFLNEIIPGHTAVSYAYPVAT